MCDSQNGAGVPDFWLGVASSLIGSVVLNFGINLQRFAHLKLEKLPFERRVHYTQHPIWIGGFIIFLVGNLGDAVGLSFTPQSVITPIGSVSLVSNLLFARLLRWETYMILLGALFSAPSQLRYLNAGLRHFEALFIVPVFYAFWVFGSITVGGIYFDEFVGFKHWQYGVFAAGVVINVGGVAVLASRSLSSPVEPPLTPVHTRIAVSTTSTKDEIPQQPSAERTFFSYMPSLPWTTQRTPAVPDPGAATQRSSTSTV
ncbi:hypothetical protein T492DRAFT_1146332 [Pavlovales sp. CCMP2436]|nr:hypothetical protein T492DRAFT_1146332 [Pavlovales sp. CCMP2436]